MFGTFHLFTVRDVPIRIHFTTILLLAFLSNDGVPWVITFLFACMVLASVALHELGHTVIAQRYGVKVKDILLTPIGGVARLSHLPEDPHKEIRIALAGPYISLALALLLAAASLVLQRTLFKAVVPFFLLSAFSNLVFFLFNLLPSFPMDGGRILRAWLTTKKGPLEATRIATEAGRGIAILFIVSGILVKNYILVFVGIFVLYGGGAEYRMMKIRSWQNRSADAPGEMEADFVAGPPPYEQSSYASLKTLGGFPRDIILTAKELAEEISQTLRMRP